MCLYVCCVMAVFFLVPELIFYSLSFLFSFFFFSVFYPIIFCRFSVSSRFHFLYRKFW